MNDQVRFLSRRQVLVTGALGGMMLLADGATAQQGLAPTPACHDGDEPTMPQIEGPFFKPKSPLRSDLREPGISGRPIELFGVVQTRRCRPIAGALVDLWQADDKGDYDAKSFHLRGHVFTDAEGRYSFRTIMPGLYPGRTRHFHAKIQAPRSRLLTTQFYFPDEPRNRFDEYFAPELVMAIADNGDELQARYDVVLALR
jgi:protocatechuate 3,4-dioxygenase beta subunit